MRARSRSRSRAGMAGRRSAPPGSAGLRAAPPGSAAAAPRRRAQRAAAQRRPRPDDADGHRTTDLAARRPPPRQSSSRPISSAWSSPAPDSCSCSCSCSETAVAAEVSRRSHRGMSTPAQMATIATYRIALLNSLPSAPRVADRRRRCQLRPRPNADALPSSSGPHVTQRNSSDGCRRAPRPVCRHIRRAVPTDGPGTRRPGAAGSSRTISPRWTVTPAGCSATAASARAALPRRSARNTCGPATPR